MEQEIWKDIKGYEGLYRVSNFGRVYSIRNGILLKQWLRGRKGDEYLTIDLSRKMYSVHRLVAQAFIPNPENKPQVNHKDGNKLNNNVENLEWVTDIENQRHAVANGLRTYIKGSNNTKCILSKDDVRYIKNNFIYKDTNFGAVGLAKRFNVDKKTIMNIINGITYCDVKVKRTIYCVSDIHSGYDYLIDSLKKTGFNPNKYTHLLIVLGDCFDRLTQSEMVYNYLTDLQYKGKCIVVKGNHDIMLEKYLDGTTINPWNYVHNGTNETLGDFLHCTLPFETYCSFRDLQPTIGEFGKWIGSARNEINKEFPHLLPWLQNLPYYYETKNYIFVHGAIDTEVEDWHKPHCLMYDYKDWEALTWDDGSFFGKDIKNTNKTVVIGHFGTDDLREKYGLPNGEKLYDILKREDGRIIAIDTCTALTKRVNVLVLEDELLEG